MKARSRTYAGNAGKTKALFTGSTQYEFNEGRLMYRDVYYVGRGRFVGMEAIYEGDIVLWSMSYFGDFSRLTEVEADTVLRKALSEKKDTARLWLKEVWKSGEYEYVCQGHGNMSEFEGTEYILKSGTQVYRFTYASTRLDP